jgi:hypothetical protein
MPHTIEPVSRMKYGQSARSNYNHGTFESHEGLLIIRCSASESGVQFNQTVN